MAADTADTLQKVDSLVDEGKDKPAKRRASSLRADVFNMSDLGELHYLTCQLPAARRK
jgi:hypothetical protein